MKINVLSDLHLGFGSMDRPMNDADIVVLAGDISRPREAAAWAMRFDKPVLYVPGNHEFYGSSLSGAIEELQRLCAGTQVQVLHDTDTVLHGVRFLGATLWTDFALFEDPAKNATAMDEARRLVRDFSRVRLTDTSDALLTAEESAVVFARQAEWLAQRLDERHDGPTVVITHHAPSPRSIHPRFAGSLLNACFVSDAERLLGHAQVWIHGHTHDSFDYRVKGTRIVCNARGYAKAGVNENPRFDPDFMIDVSV
jgi:predicted phosphodiesterase